MKRKRIAIIGSGISGLTCAYHLSANHDVTLYEAADYIGGHTHTVEVEKDGEKSKIDTGFIVFNDRTYPNFIKLMNELGVSYQPTEMSFSVRNDQLDLEYNGNTLNSLFAQRTNLLRPQFWKLLRDIMRFNKDVRKVNDDKYLTLGTYLKERDYSKLFVDNYLLPMISAIWSMGLESCRDFPLQFFVRFFDNHGLLNIINRPQWYTIRGGSSSYVEPLTKRFKENIHLNTPVTKVVRQDDTIRVQTNRDEHLFDEIIFACHGDQVLPLLENPSGQEQAVLKEFKCTDNQVILHTDTTLLPRRKLAWASWNYKLADAAKDKTTLTYNMNILQRLNKQHTYLVTLNQDIDPQYVLGRFSYSHPVYTTGSIEAQNKWHQTSGTDRIHYCGAYWFSGFHEDGVTSGLRVCNMLEEER